MFLRGVLEVGDGGPEERANKQVAEGGRGETPIPCCARPLLHIIVVTKAMFKLVVQHSSARLYQHGERPTYVRVQVILLSNHLFFDLAFFTEREKKYPSLQ